MKKHQDCCRQERSLFTSVASVTEGWGLQPNLHCPYSTLTVAAAWCTQNLTLTTHITGTNPLLSLLGRPHWSQGCSTLLSISSNCFSLKILCHIFLVTNSYPFYYNLHLRIVSPLIHHPIKMNLELRWFWFLSTPN